VGAVALGNADGMVDGSLGEAAEEFGRALSSAGLTVAVAESLTAGAVASALGAAHGAATWFRGGVVAYAPEVKFAVLGVEPGPVATRECAEQMARGVAELMGADAAAATTGVGGPGPNEGKPAGTVFIAVRCRGRSAVTEHHFRGDPSAVVDQATRAVLAALREAIS
jgi:nicotinamide-nucleotide amidase